MNILQVKKNVFTIMFVIVFVTLNQFMSINSYAKDDKINDVYNGGTESDNKNEVNYVFEETNDSKFSSDDYIEVNEENFPDKNVREALLENNNDGLVWKYSVSLDLTDRNLYSVNLEGLQLFDDVYLDLSNNNLKEIDVSNLKNLKILRLNNNNLISIDLSNNTELGTLELSNNNLNSIDLSNNTKLNYLDVSINYLQELDISNCNLCDLNIANNNIIFIDLKNSTSLYNLNAYNNNLSNIDISNNTNLASLDISWNPISEIDLSNNPEVGVYPDLAPLSIDEKQVIKGSGKIRKLNITVHELKGTINLNNLDIDFGDLYDTVKKYDNMIKYNTDTNEIYYDFSEIKSNDNPDELDGPYFYMDDSFAEIYMSFHSGIYDDDYFNSISILMPTDYRDKDGNIFHKDLNGNVTCIDKNGNSIIDEFKSDGVYTYYFQADGTAMKDRLTYHPDGVHVIYFDSEGHEVFSDFANVRKTIAGDEVDDFCFFDVFGYMYVDVLTYDKTGSVLYYANPYGVMEMGKWFQFSDTVEWADGTPAEGIAGGYGYANADGTLMTNTATYDWEGRSCYLQGNGVALY